MPTLKIFKDQLIAQDTLEIEEMKVQRVQVI